MEPITVLSLFDGMSCLQIALERAGIPVKAYYASEVDKYAIKVTQANYPNTIQLGDITKWREWDLPDIDFIAGGSPCQGFSFAGKQLAFDDPKSKLFFMFHGILKHHKPKKFLLENVVMSEQSNDVISSMLGALYPECVTQRDMFKAGRLEPVKINSRDFSAQNRPRFYWTNIKVNYWTPKQILLGHILEDCPPDYIKISLDGDVKEWQGKMSCLTGGHRGDGNHSDMDLIGVPVAFTEARTEEAKRIRREFREKWGRDFSPRRAKRLVPRTDGKMNCLTATYSKAENTVLDRNWLYRRYTCVECERGQTVPDNYTNHVSNSQRYKMLGNGWTVDVIVHILKGLR